MAVPNYRELLNPLLKSLRERGGSASIPELEESVCRIFGLSEEDTLHIHRGKRTQFSYNLASARSCLKRYGLLKNSGRGVWALTDQGHATEEVVPEVVTRTLRQEDRTARKTAHEADKEQPCAMHTDYFEPDIQKNPFVVMSPTHDGALFCLLCQGSRDDVAPQLTAYREAFRALLRKHRVSRPSAAAVEAAALDICQFRLGAYLVVVPAQEIDDSRFMKRVRVLCAEDTLAAAVRIAESSGCTALLFEVVGLADGQGPVDSVAWVIAPR